MLTTPDVPWVKQTSTSTLDSNMHHVAHRNLLFNFTIAVKKDEVLAQRVKLQNAHRESFLDPYRNRRSLLQQVYQISLFHPRRIDRRIVRDGSVLRYQNATSSVTLAVFSPRERAMRAPVGRLVTSASLAAGFAACGAAALQQKGTMWSNPVE